MNRVLNILQLPNQESVLYARRGSATPSELLARGRFEQQQSNEQESYARYICFAFAATEMSFDRIRLNVPDLSWPEEHWRAVFSLLAEPKTLHQAAAYQVVRQGSFEIRTSVAGPIENLDIEISAFGDADALRKEYKELNSRAYLHGLAPEEEEQRRTIEMKLDELDIADPAYARFAEEIDRGYDKLEAGLSKVNDILNELLNS